MLEKDLVERLNQQINLEFYSSNLYLQMSSWCESKGLEGCAAFMKAHAAEEMGHMQKLFDYVNEAGGMAILGAIEAPRTEFESILEVFRLTLDHEILVTRKINELVEVSMEKKDYSTFNFLQWYVAEQHEEESLFRSILDKVELIGTDKRGLFLLDREIGKIHQGAGAPPGSGPGH
jgi:ferritin